MLARLAAAFALFALFQLSAAQEEKWRVSAGALFGQTWLGSQDLRQGGYYAIARSRPEPRLHFWGHAAEMDVEAYYMYTKGGHWSILPTNNSHHYGVMLVGRYFQRTASRTRAFLEAGWGLQYTNRVTHDIDSNWNSTPMIGLGFDVELKGYDLMFGARYFHISNAGTVGGNEGLNFLQFQVGFRY